jgi:hypothetical protein
VADLNAASARPRQHPQRCPGLTKPWDGLVERRCVAGGSVHAVALNDPQKRGPGRPRRPPVRTTPLSDIDAFWRLKSRALGLDSHQAMRTVAFCAVWQRNGGSVKGVVAAGRYGRRTAYNRLRTCRLAGFEPDLVRFRVQSEDDWEAEDRHQIALTEQFYREEVERRERLPPPIRVLTKKPKRYRDFLEED